ncbi:MAG: zinc metalloprotease HtpX [Candidatus Nanoarchaeia archaeon]|nr:zinc metalloprotease HtpX [Candidatus Haiyanarchaeum thermophilum]MCW1303170.1 zinc metalloprotease HtpX [Candidatus Haiyanarchaeum thermophilum]MCW1303835.1 zinc metalloprotease HtpX [Candidatus Haiyanarchaeum thermophilum]MCW1306548.1 zinc metalloprotease HtpX [Candidatus Haiyanarchaeum thermophilum]MCW1306962.1 zinc metalloprotease HtpX [Candidatus Haiyanarchaeum thermophilum]
MKGLFRLKLIATFTLALVFGIVAGIFSLLIWLSGASGLSALSLALILSLSMLLIEWWLSPVIIRSLYRMRELDKREHLWIHQIVEEICEREGMKKPKLYLVDDPTPNAFAFGRSKNSGNVAIHTGLLELLDREEVKTVIAHELGHIRNRDMVVMCIASTLPILLYYLALALTPRDERRGGLGVLIFLFALLARFVGQLIVLWISRSREYFADGFSAYITKNPKGLASALAKISYNLPKYRKTQVHSALRAFYISDPFSNESLRYEMEKEKRYGLLELFSTHPLTYKRIERLKQIAEEL